MKTFLGFTTGLFGGTIIGLLTMAVAILASKELRDYAEEIAFDSRTNEGA